MIVNDAPVRQAPAGMNKHRGDRPTRIEGRVVSYDRVKQEARIATKQGEITVKTDIPLPPDAEVIVELYVKNGVELARIALLKQQVEMAEQAVKLAQAAKLPPLKPGDTATALLMPGEGKQVEPLPQVFVTLQRVAVILEQLTVADLQKLPQPFPVPAEVVMKLAASNDLFRALQQLPPGQQKAIVEYVTRPDVIKALKTIVPPQALAGITSGAAPPVEDHLVEIIPPKPLLPQAKVTAQPAAPASQPGIQNLLHLLETLQTPTGMPGGLMPRLATPAASAAMVADILPKNMHQVQIVSVTPPDLPPPPAPVAPVQQGTVEFTTSDGFPVLKTDNGHFILKIPATVETGSIIQFEAMPMTSQQILSGVAVSAVPAASFHPLRSPSWPALQETLQVVATAAPETAAQMQNTIPSATPRLAPTALFFMAALKIGVVESWLGSAAVQQLRDMGRQNLAERLTGDFGRISAQAKDSVGGEWRAISMPMLHEGEISQMQFYIRRQQDEAEKEKEETGRAQPTRFILNLHLSRMGEMQLDGLLRKKTFDLILRSAEALPFTMRQELMQSFAKGLAQAEMQGGISFQTRAQGWVTMELPQQGTVA